MSSAPPATTRLGLTGGIGSGKSTVAQMLLQCGAVLIDADQLARHVTGPGGAAMAAIAQVFGPEYVDANGALDRQRMRTLAFSQPASRQQLEAIIHPLVGQLTGAQVDAAVAAGQRLVVFDGYPLAVSGQLIEQLRQRTRQSSEQPAVPVLQAGEKVRITDGPFAELEAIFHSMDGLQRAVLLLNMLNHQQKIHLPLNILVKS